MGRTDEMDPQDLLSYQKSSRSALKSVIRCCVRLPKPGRSHRFHGDDTPVAVLSKRERPLYDYFRQQFAQVTNPPIDPLREAIVMSLETCVGAERNVFEETADHADRAILSTPVLSHSKFTNLLNIQRPGYEHTKLSLHDPKAGLKQAVLICATPRKAVRDGKVILVLTDHGINLYLTIPALMATGAVHHSLTEKGLRLTPTLLWKPRRLAIPSPCCSALVPPRSIRTWLMTLSPTWCAPASCWAMR